jgi:DNA-binding transcriptional regulator YdaS (Cro superfamily)
MSLIRFAIRAKYQNGNHLAPSKLVLLPPYHCGIHRSMTLAQWLQLASVSQADFARVIGVTQATVCRYAAGTRIPRRAMMVRIQEATGGKVTPADFYAAAEQPPPQQAAA